MKRLIISASRRTDIPAFYSEWFFNRIKEGYVLVRNPMNFRRISKISLSKKVVDFIVFWTKNAAPMLSRIEELSDYQYCFQFTLTPYSKDIEPFISKPETLDTFLRLSQKIGSDRIIWRYDPIIINEKYTVQYHVKAFKELSGKLKGSFSKCVISFVDLYRKNAKYFRENKLVELNENQILRIAEDFSGTAYKYGFNIASCAEAIDLSLFGIEHSSCVDKEMIEKLIGFRLNVKKDKNQRKECGCCESIDIGAYDTCLNGCKYCYANSSINNITFNNLHFDPLSPLLCGSISENDILYEREVKSLKILS